MAGTDGRDETLTAPVGSPPLIPRSLLPVAVSNVWSETAKSPGVARIQKESCHNMKRSDRAILRSSWETVSFLLGLISRCAFEMFLAPMSDDALGLGPLLKTLCLEEVKD